MLQLNNIITSYNYILHTTTNYRDSKCIKRNQEGIIMYKNNNYNYI